MLKVTASVCKQCGTVNFPGCREHKMLLTLEYANDEVHTCCGKKKCTTNTYASKFPCVTCKGVTHDVYRLSVMKRDVDEAVQAFQQRAGGKAVAGMKMDSCLIACMHCASLVFPVIGKQLCTLDQSGNLCDGHDQQVDLENWKAKLPHNSRKCLGFAKGPYARIDVRIDFGELEFLHEMLGIKKASSDKKWKSVFFEGRNSGDSRAVIPIANPAQPFKGGPIYSPEAPASRFYPLAMSLCKCCGSLTFCRCIRHNTLLTKAEVRDQPLSVAFSCATEGCQTDPTARLRCKSTKSTASADWIPVLYSKTEAAYLKKAWYGRGLHFHSSLAFASKILMCKHCKSISFPGVNNKICELRNDCLVIDQRNSDVNPRNFRYSHTHLEGCPFLGNFDALTHLKVLLLGDEVEHLQRFVNNTPTGLWSEEVLRVRDIVTKTPSGTGTMRGSPEAEAEVDTMNPVATRVVVGGSTFGMTIPFVQHRPEGGASLDFTFTSASSQNPSVPQPAHPTTPDLGSYSSGVPQHPGGPPVPMAYPPPQAGYYPTLPYGAAPPPYQVPQQGYNPFAAPVDPSMSGGVVYPTADFAGLSLASAPSEGLGSAPSAGHPPLYPILPTHPPGQPPFQSSPHATLRSDAPPAWTPPSI